MLATINLVQDIREAIKKKFDKLTITKGQACEIAQINRTTLNRFLNGETDIGVNNLFRLLAILEIEVRIK